MFTIWVSSQQVFKKKNKINPESYRPKNGPANRSATEKADNTKPRKDVEA